jgi:hypothetical protein
MSRASLGIVAFAAAGALAVACGGGDESSDVGESPDAGSDATTSIPDTSVPDTSSAADAADASSAADAADAAVGTNLDGGACDGGAVAVTDVTPKFGSTADKTPLTVSGSGFMATPKIYLRAAGGALTPLTSVAFVSSTSITGIAPSSLAVGAYDVVVVDPSDCASFLAGSFKVVADPAPVVLGVTPESGTTQNDVDVTVTGCNFPANASLATVSAPPASTQLAQIVKTAPVAGAADARCNGDPLYTMTGTIQTKTKTMPVGAYLVRVSNPTNSTFGDYSSFVVNNPTGNLAAGGWTTGPSLVVGRRSLGLLAGRVNDASRFLYAIGGETSAGVALKTVEVAPLDRFGQAGAWFVEKNQLGVARSGLSVVRQGKYLYAIGGTSSTNGTGGAAPAGAALGSIERAVILDPSGAPKITDPVVDVASGTLAKGTYYYKVAAFLDNGDPQTAGETLSTDEAVATLSANGNVALTWTAPAVGSVLHYRVYRSKTADGASGSEVLLKDNIVGTTYTDTGADVPGAEVPQQLGSTGPWVTTTALLHPRIGSAATIAADPGGGRHLYVTGGYGQCAATTGIMDCYEHATISNDGATLGGTFLAGATPLAHARMRHGAAELSADNGPPNFTASASATTAFVVVGGGKGINTAANTVEYALVGAAGVLGTWAVPGNGFANQRDGTQIIVSNGYGYALAGGIAPNYSGTNDQSPLAVVTATTLTFPSNWANAGANLPMALGRHGAASESAFFYIAGGTTSDSDALSTVYQIMH